MDYEFDPECPYWRSGVDAARLYEQHAEAIGDLYEALTGDTASEIPGVCEMRGRFGLLISNERVHNATFTPGEGNHRAVVVPVLEGGTIIDIVAIGDEGLWACVTGRGASTGNIESARVYKSARQWLLFGQDGILVLDKSAYAGLNTGQQLIAEDLDHADELAYRVFSLPAFESAGSEAADAAELLARDLVVVDSERCDVEAEMKRRTFLTTYFAMKQRNSSGSRFSQHDR